MHSMWRYGLPCILFCLIGTSAHAQSGRTLDSLDALLASKQADTARVSTLLHYAKLVNSSSVYFSHKYTLQALELSQRIKYRRGEAWALFLLVGFGEYLDPAVRPRDWLDTLTRSRVLAADLQDHELLARMEFSQADSARVHGDALAARKQYEIGLVEARKCNSTTIWLWEKYARAAVLWTESKRQASQLVLDSLFVTLLSRPSEDFSLNRVGELLIARAQELSKSDSTALPRVLHRLRESLSYNRIATNVHREAQLHDVLASYYVRAQDANERLLHLQESLKLYTSAGSRLNAVALYPAMLNVMTEQHKTNDIASVVQGYLTAAEQSKDLQAMRNANVAMGSYYLGQSKQATGAGYYMRAKEYADQLGYLDLTAKSEILDPLSWIFVSLRQFTKARELLKEQLNNSIRIVHRGYLISTLNALGNSYYYANQADSALMFYRYCKEAIDRHHFVDFPGEDMYIISNMALAFSIAGQADSALKYAKELTACHAAGREHMVSVDLPGFDRGYYGWHGLIMSNIFMTKKNYDSAVWYAERGRLSADTTKYDLFRKHITDALWKAYKAKGDYVRALQYFEEFRRVSDTLESGSVSEQVAFSETATKLERRQHEIELLRRDGKLHEAELKAQELIAAQSRLESIARQRENQSLTSANLLNKETIKRLDQEQKTLEALAAKQVQENRLLLQEKEIKEAEAARQRMTNLASFGGAGLMAILAFVLFRSNRQKNQQNQIIEQEREKSDALLLNVLPTSIAARLKAGERDIADHYDAVSILFADIVGFTPLSARYTPRAMVSLLNNLYTRFDRLTEQCGVERIKTIGDAYMVVAGAPEACDDHAERIANYALKMRQELQNFCDEIHENIELRIGISCGEAVGAVVGEKKFAYDLWSDAVNMASRMESHGEAGKIHVSEEFCQHIQQRTSSPHANTLNIRCEKRGGIEVKGKGILQTYFLETL